MTRFEESRARAEDLFVQHVETGDSQPLADALDLVAPGLLAAARALTRDADEVEDLVQETLLTAIDRKEAFSSGAALLPWLRGILANLWKRRLAARRPDPDRLADRHAERAEHDPAEVVHRKHLVGEVRAAIAKLPTRYREVVSPHIEAGLTAEAIASTLQRPASTVRTQLARGLERLRRSLPPTLTLGAIAYLCTRRAIATGGAAAEASPADTLGREIARASTDEPSGAHTKRRMLAAAALLMALVGSLLIFGQQPARGSGGPSVPGTGPPGSPLAVGDPVGAPPPSGQAARRELDPAETPGAVTVVLRWSADDQPARGLSVRLKTDITPGQSVLRAALHKWRHGVADENGVARFADVPPGQARLVLDDGQAQLRPFRVEPGEQVQRVERLPAPVRVYRGTVTDPDGLPVAGAEVWLSSTSASATPGYVAARTGPDGKYEVPVFRRKTHVWARAPGFSLSNSFTAGTELAVYESETVLPRSPCQLGGTVAGPDGVECAGALVGIYSLRGSTPNTFCLTDSSGRFSVSDLRAGPHQVLVQAPGHAIAAAEVELRAETEASLSFSLEPGARLEGRVVGSHGVPVEDLRVVGVPSSRFDRGGAYGLLNCFSAVGEGGRFTLGDLAGGLLRVTVFNRRKPTERLAGQNAWVTPGRTRDIVLVVGARGGISGQVLKRDGRPLSGARVFAIPTELSWQLAAHAAMVTVAKTDGSFELGGLQDRSYTCFVHRPAAEESSPGMPIARVRNVRAGARGLRIEVPIDLAPAWIQGRLEYDPAEPTLLGTLVGKWLDGTHKLNAKADPDSGAFRLGPFPPGEYVVGTQSNDKHGVPGYVIWTGKLSAGEEKVLGVIRPGRTGVVSARFRFPDGTPVARGRFVVVTAVPPFASAEIASGRASPIRLFPGRYRFFVRAGSFARFSGELDVKPGETTPLDVTLQPGTLCNIECLRPVGSLPPHARVRALDGGPLLAHGGRVTRDRVYLPVGLAPGRYVFEASTLDGRATREVFEVGPPSLTPRRLVFSLR